MEIIWATPLYEFLRECNESGLEKVILDCGAGSPGSHALVPPPLSIFYQSGYRTFGVEIQEEALTNANRYCRKNGMRLNIIGGDMRHLPFRDFSFSFVYSFNAIFFMTKADIARALKEMERVLSPNGLCFVNFISTDDPDRRPFCESAPIKRLLGSEGFSYHGDDEADMYFSNFDILLKQKKFIDKLHEGQRLKQVLIEYIARKKPYIP